jgi:hypothetical protein
VIPRREEAGLPILRLFERSQYLYPNLNVFVQRAFNELQLKNIFIIINTRKDMM